MEVDTVPRLGMVVPVRNPGPEWCSWLVAYSEQTRTPDALVVMDSSSDDEAAALAAQYGARVLRVKSGEYDHGGTRQAGVDALIDADLVIFATQDAVLADRRSIELLVASVEADPTVGAGYGRQLPRNGAGPIETHARLFGYPPADRTTNASDIPSLGLKAGFLSDSFACYRVSALLGVGGFPIPAAFGEDAVVGARLVLSGWSIAYVSRATVYHSHGYSLAEEARRYFDVGALHAMEPWIQDELGAASGEGARFLISEIAYLARRAPHRLPEALVRTLSKYAMYQTGRHHALLPARLKCTLSMNPSYWRSHREVSK